MLEEKIKKLIIEKYGSIRQFALKIDVPYTTVDTILKRGIDNSNVGNVIKICKTLGLSVDKSIEKKDLILDTNIDEKKQFSEEEKKEALKQVLKDKGFLNENEEISKDDVNKLIDFAKRNKDYIIDKREEYY